MIIEGTTFSDYPDELRLFLNRLQATTLKDLATNHSPDLLFRHTVEELGEYAAAKTVEEGIKKKDLKENSLIESVDLVICALSLFYANGGTEEKLHEIGQRKLNKWDERLKNG
jgi:NTP pyrophosphatase (non-canonical NTP hydrolase)